MKTLRFAVAISSILFFIPVFAVAEPTYEKAQHRLPPVIYSLDIPKLVVSGNSYDFSWTVMGYHDTYDIIINVYSASGSKIASERVSPSYQTKGEYSWDTTSGIDSREFHYTKKLNLSFDGSQELTVRFFASPIDDPIDNSFLSCLVPGGLGYTAGDTTGRKITISGVQADTTHELTYTPPNEAGIVFIALGPSRDDYYVADNTRIYQDISYEVNWGDASWDNDLSKITMRVDLDHCVLLKIAHWNDDSTPMTVKSNADIEAIWQGFEAQGQSLSRCGGNFKRINLD